jgi:hypothetical protein
MQVEIKDETLNFLKDLMRRYVTQDSRGTAKPYYFVVNTTREMAAPAGTTGNEKYYYDGCTFTEKELRDHCKEYELDFDIERGSATPYDVQDVEEYSNFFLTKEGYDEHMKLNEHNYRHFKGSPRSYIMYANRNPEIDSLLKALCEITGEEYK